jgi:hypothetical protein
MPLSAYLTTFRSLSKIDSSLVAQRWNLILWKVLIRTPPIAKNCKAINGSDAKMKDQDETRTRIATQEGENIWVRVEEGVRC